MIWRRPCSPRRTGSDSSPALPACWFWSEGTGRRTSRGSTQGEGTYRINFPNAGYRYIFGVVPGTVLHLLVPALLYHLHQLLTSVVPHGPGLGRFIRKRPVRDGLVLLSPLSSVHSLSCGLYRDRFKFLVLGAKNGILGFISAVILFQL